MRFPAKQQACCEFISMAQQWQYVGRDQPPPGPPAASHGPFQEAAGTPHQAPTKRGQMQTQRTEGRPPFRPRPMSLWPGVSGGPCTDTCCPCRPPPPAAALSRHLRDDYRQNGCSPSCSARGRHQRQDSTCTQQQEPSSNTSLCL